MTWTLNKINLKKKDAHSFQSRAELYQLMMELNIIWHVVDQWGSQKKKKKNHFQLKINHLLDYNGKENNQFSALNFLLIVALQAIQKVLKV